MPRGIFPHTNNHPHKSHLKKADVMEFVRFCFREDIAKQLESMAYPHQKAVELYKKETGKEISPQTAYHQRGRWAMVNGELCEIMKRKHFVQVDRPKTPHRKKPFEAPIRPATPPPATTLNSDDALQVVIEPDLIELSEKANSVD